MDDDTLSIGEVAGRAGIGSSAIRYYEAEGLLPEPLRVAGRRRYSDDVFARLGVIDVAKRAGFSLADIRTLLEAGDAGEPAHAALRELAGRRLPEVEALVEWAEAVRGWLQAASSCDCETLDVCALFQEKAPPPH
jgi:MerR family redox-sensitive transcriptional activator SoxR